MGDKKNGGVEWMELCFLTTTDISKFDENVDYQMHILTKLKNKIVSELQDCSTAGISFLSIIVDYEKYVAAK